MMIRPLDYQRYAILFVDDEPQTLKYFERAFSQDFRILTAVSAAEAWDTLKQQADEIAVLMADERMPRQQGVELLKQTRLTYPHIVRLLTTAYLDIDETIEAINTGEIFRYITKPWDIKFLREQLYSAIHLFLVQAQERHLLEEKRRAMLTLAANIAHELRNPLLIIRSAAAGVEKYLPQLMEVYEQAQNRGEPVPPIRAAHRHTLTHALEGIQNEVSHAQTVIDMLLANINVDKPYQQTTALHSMQQCVEEALARYPFKADQRKRVYLLTESEDFLFRGSRTLFSHVFFNLIKNALYALAEKGAPEGRITFRLAAGERENRVYIRDNGTGIPPETLPFIFDDFHSSKSDGLDSGLGIGLSFCRRTLRRFNGEIDCHSEAGIYTEFILRLPPVTETLESSPLESECNLDTRPNER